MIYLAVLAKFNIHLLTYPDKQKTLANKLLTTAVQKGQMQPV